eukprot:1085950_1
MSTYTWKITDTSLVQQMKNAKNKAKWNSSAFSAGGFRWYLEVNPNGTRESSLGYVKVYLYLACLPPKVKSIQIGYELCLIETGTVFKGNKTFEKEHINAGGFSKQLQTNTIQNLTTLTFSAKINIYGVFDHEDNDITNLYVGTDNEESKHSALECAKQSDHTLIDARLDSLSSSIDKLVNNVQSLQQQFTDLQQRVHVQEEQKDNIDSLRAEMKVIKHDLRKLPSIAKTDPKQLELKSWLQNEVGFPQYYDIFMENGIEDLSIASLLTMETIKRMGIDKMGHQMKILRAVTKLNHNDINEGGKTAYM